MFMVGDKVAVAHTGPVGNAMLLVGRVVGDGQQVLWYELVNEYGVPSNAVARGVRPGRPVPLSGNEFPIPERFAALVPDAPTLQA
jgi:hypothetical protein